MKPREPRRKVMLKARMRVAAGWTDVCIGDISSRGLMMHAAAPPPRGAFIEIRRGQFQIAARVVWSSERRFGVRTQDVLPIDAVIDLADAPIAGAGSPGGAVVERRRTPRPTAERHERSRMLSRAMEFAMIGLFVAWAAVATFGAVGSALYPLRAVSAALAPK